MTTDAVPRNVADFARAREFGAHLATYRPRTLRRGVAMLLGLAGGLCLLGALVAVLAEVWPAGLACAALGALFLYLLARTPGFSGRQAAKRVDVFENGFIQSDGSGPRADFRWDSIGSVCQRITRNYTNGLYTGTTYLYKITRHDGVTTKLTEFYDGIAALGETIAREVGQVQLPRAMEAIQHGQTVIFGDLALNAGGIACTGRGSVPWTDIERVQVNRGYVSLRRAGKWLAWSSKPASQIPNLFVFLTLADLLQHTPPRT
ncbi:MAG: hypothetical protein V7603_385 [Micromonosporaceae bacterium]